MMMMMARAPAVAIDLIHHHGAFLSLQQGAAKPPDGTNGGQPAPLADAARGITPTTATSKRQLVQTC